MGLFQHQLGGNEFLGNKRFQVPFFQISRKIQGRFNSSTTNLYEAKREITTQIQLLSTIQIYSCCSLNLNLLFLFFKTKMFFFLLLSILFVLVFVAKMFLQCSTSQKKEYLIIS